MTTTIKVATVMVALGYIAAADTEIPCGLVTVVKSEEYEL